MTPAVSIIIPTKNAGSGFPATLNAIQNQDFAGAVELVVIDSGSTDGTVNLALQSGARVMRIPPEEFDHGATRQRAMKEARGEVFVLLTQDAQPVGRAWLRALIMTFSDRRIAGVYARHLPRANANALTKRKLSKWPTARSEFALQEISNIESFSQLPPAEQFYRCLFDNVCSAIRRDAWRDIPMLPTYFGEDIEWARRALLAGWRIAFQPNAVVIHSHDRSAIYEYKRNYLTLHKLYTLFRLVTVPTVGDVLRLTLRETFDDWGYLWRSGGRAYRLAPLMARVPIASFAKMLGQYQGASDAQRGVRKSLAGV